jgi:hypothetical protein
MYRAISLFGTLHGLTGVQVALYFSRCLCRDQGLAEGNPPVV